MGSVIYIAKPIGQPEKPARTRRPASARRRPPPHSAAPPILPRTHAQTPRAHALSLLAPADNSPPSCSGRLLAALELRPRHPCIAAPAPLHPYSLFPQRCPRGAGRLRAHRHLEQTRSGAQSSSPKVRAGSSHEYVWPLVELLRCIFFVWFV